MAVPARDELTCHLVLKTACERHYSATRRNLATARQRRHEGSEAARFRNSAPSSRQEMARGSRSVAGSSELAYPRLEQRPGPRSVNLLPACVERAERFAEPARVRFVDNHSFAAEHAQRVCIELPDVLALAERRDLGVLVDDRLNIGGKRLPCLPIGDQREARPPVVRHAQIGLHLVELEP